MLAPDMSSRITILLYELVYADCDLAVENANKHEQLRFPLFHSELLTQIWANPAQSMGTVRIVITEGIRQGQSSGKFMRLRNIVTFSFQHAPLRRQHPGNERCIG